MNPVVHFEVPFENRDRMVDFYKKVFGWNPTILGPEMGDYVLVETTKTDEKTQRPAESGAINGGLFPKTSDNQHPSIVVSVDDIYAAMKKVEEAGGKVLGGSYKVGEPDDIPGIGLYSACIDTEGNRISLLQPKGM